MKKVLLAAAMTMMSVSAFANYCEVDLIDNRGRLVQRISERDYEGNCKESMKECRKTIRDRYVLGQYDCVRSTVNYPNPNPRPYPNPNPNPGPIGSDARRMLNNGESAIMSGRYVTVMGVSFQGLYAVRSTDGWNTITNGVRREALSVTNGCAYTTCTSDSVIDIQSARYVTVVGISFDERVTTKSTDGWNTLVSGIETRNLAATKGCINSRYAQLCVGNQVINNMNRYSTVVGIQQDGRVVLKSSDGWNTLSTNVDPGSLVVTR